MVSRDELYQQFGPKLLEAMQIYNLETMKLKLKDRELVTEQQMLDRLQEILDTLTNYSWM